MKSKSFNVIIYDVNKQDFTKYDVISYLTRRYKEKYKNKRIDFDELQDFVKKESLYMYWSRCEWEIIISSWPTRNCEKKIDVYNQIMNNIITVTEILESNLFK